MEKVANLASKIAQWPKVRPQPGIAIRLIGDSDPAKQEGECWRSGILYIDTPLP